MTHPVRAAALLLTAVALTASCTRAPKVALAPLATQPACATVAWPATVGGLPRTPTDPVAPSVAAWGDPAVIARCGLPAQPPTTEACVTVNGVDWVVRDLTDGTAAITYGREPALEVLAPQAHGPVPLLLPAFAAAARSLPETGRHCA